MNKFLKEEFNKLDIQIDKIDDTHYHIPKADKPYIKFEVGKTYLIELESYITNPPSNFTLQDNWNNGVIPKSTFMKVCITQKMGKMNKVDGIGVDYINDLCYNDNNETYLGLWLPEGGMKKIKEI